MSQQLLHHFEFCPHTPKKSRVRSSTLVALICEDPVICPRVAGTFLLLQQCVRKKRMNGHGLCDDSVLHGPTTPYTMERVTLIFAWAKSMSPHFQSEQLALPQAGGTCKENQCSFSNAQVVYQCLDFSGHQDDWYSAPLCTLTN